MATHFRLFFFLLGLAVNFLNISGTPIHVVMEDGKRFFYIEALVGTPPLPFKMLLNTSSNLTTLSCVNCVNCVPQKTHYQPSTTGKVCPSCTYSRSFTEGYNNISSNMGMIDGFTNGFMVQDIISIDDDIHGLVAFGCATSELGIPNSLDGMLGLSLGPENVVSEAIGDNSFSICFPGDSADKGYMTLGHIYLPENVMYVAVDDLGGFYSLTLNDIRINKKSALSDIDVALGGVVVNTMRQPSFFHEDLYTMMLEGIEEVFSQFKVDNPKENCYNFQRKHFKTIPAWPTLDIVNWEGVVFSFPPSNYLLQNIDRPGEYCLDFFASFDANFSVLGGRMFRDILFSYDKKNLRMEFSHKTCSDGDREEGGEKEKGGKGVKHYLILIIVIGSILLVLTVLAVVHYGKRFLRQIQEGRFMAPVPHQIQQDPARESTHGLVGTRQSTEEQIEMAARDQIEMALASVAARDQIEMASVAANPFVG